MLCCRKLSFCDIITKIVQGYGENLAAAGIPDASVDAVIMTLVLCSVEDQRKCIKVGTILILVVLITGPV
jgi:hypothetical protein